MTDVLILTHSKDNSCVDTVTTAVQDRKSTRLNSSH